MEVLSFKQEYLVCVHVRTLACIELENVNSCELKLAMYVDDIVPKQ